MHVLYGILYNGWDVPHDIVDIDQDAVYDIPSGGKDKLYVILHTGRDVLYDLLSGAMIHYMMNYMRTWMYYLL